MKKSSGGYRSDDISLLLPSFRLVVENLLMRLQMLGFEPVLRDGLRTRAEAAANAVQGTGIDDSMHIYGCAADIICGAHGWKCAEHGCGFYQALGPEAEALKLVWGGRFMKVVNGKRVPDPDLPHVQGVEIRDQVVMRALGDAVANAVHRDAIVRAFLARRLG